MKTARATSLILATLLQLLPLCRTALVTITTESPNLAIIFRWLAGSAAIWGSVDAVSGASTVITSVKTATATNGVAFTYRITAGPEVPNTFNASPLPANLVVNTTSGRITGTPATTGTFLITLVASDNNKPDRTVTATLTLTIVPGVTVTAPAITAQPTNHTVTAGSTTTFTVAASGSAPLSYQWKFNGVNITGATTATYTLSNAQSIHAGAYSVLVSNSAGNVTSSAATLTVNVPPAITTPPASQTITAGSNVTFSVTAAGTAPLTYQWKFNGANITGATSSTYTRSNAQTTDAGSYSVLVSNVAGTITSAAAALTVNPVTVAPTITTPPGNQSVTVGSTASFTVAATGTGPLAYQWKFNSANVPGATSSTLTIINAQTTNAGLYSVTVSNLAGTVTSPSATLTVTPAAVAPTITTPPLSQTVTVGSNVTFTVTAAGTAPLTYQWKFNGGNIAGATGSTYTRSNVQTTDAGLYSVTVSNLARTVTSSAATLTVQTPVIIAPSIITPPASQTIIAGNSASFTVAATGTGPLAYQWKYQDAILPGATSTTLTLSNCQTNNAGAYSVVVSNVAGTVTSAAATLTVQEPATVAPSITSQPTNLTVSAGSPATFTVAATGTGPLAYQWKCHDTILPGATSTTLTLSNCQTNNAGLYTVVVSNAAGIVTSSAAALTVLPSASPTNDVTGTFAGLFYENTGARYEAAGLANLRAKQGRTRGVLRIGGTRYRFTNKLDSAGHATGVASCKGQVPLSVELQADLTNGVETVTGAVADGRWLATLESDRIGARRPHPLAGTYQVPLPDSSDTPSNSFATATITLKGRVRLRGLLPDGRKVRQTTAVSAAGIWPLYVPLRDGTALIGWVRLLDPATGATDADVHWLVRGATFP